MPEVTVAPPYQLVPTRHGTMLVNVNDIYMGQAFLRYGESFEAEIEALLGFLRFPGLVSFLVHYNPHDRVAGLKDVPVEDRPPVLPVFLSFRAMVGLGILLFWISVWAFWKRNSIQDAPRLLRLLPWVIPLPYLVNQLGWTIAEIGRQPWIVYGLMRTENGVSHVDPFQVAVSLGAFVLVYGLLGAVDFYLLWSYARKGPLPENSTTHPRHS